MVSAVVSMVVVLAVLVSGALVAMTAVLRRTTESSVTDAASVHVAEEVAIDLLLHARSRDPVASSHLEEDLKAKLTEARRLVNTETEAPALAEAESQVNTYLESARRSELSSAEITAREEAAYRAVDALVAINAAQVKQALKRAEFWEHFASFVGVAVGALVLAFGVGILAWFRHRALAPVGSLATAMERYGKGDREARAPEKGVIELREICRRFNEMAAALATQRRSQMVFLGGVAHDLRNPLSVLKMSVESLRPDKPLPSEHQLRQLVERIDRQLTRLDRMTGDFLDMEKIEAGELELKVEAHDPRPLVRDVVKLFEEAYSDHRFQVLLPSETLRVDCDRLRIEQVLGNLISNAIKYSSPGSAIEVAVLPRGDWAFLSVTDHGIGISKEDRERVFEPFQRVGLSRESVPGVGLGLFVVRRIVEAHGGRIELESTPGLGSTFGVYLPLCRDRALSAGRPGGLERAH